MKLSFGIKICGVWIFHIRISFLDFVGYKEEPEYINERIEVLYQPK